MMRVGGLIKTGCVLFDLLISQAYSPQCAAAAAQTMIPRIKKKMPTIETPETLSPPP